MVQPLGLNDTHKKQAWGRMLQDSGNTLYGAENLRRLCRLFGYAAAGVSLENTHMTPHKGDWSESAELHETDQN